TNNGYRSEGRTFSHLYDANGDLIYDNKTQSNFAINGTTAYWMTNILRDAVRYGTGYEASLGSAMPVAGKTGTSGDSKDRWFSGFTPYYTASVWTGYDAPENIVVVGRGNPASKIWKKVMELVHADLPYLDFPETANSYQPPVPGIVLMEYNVICMDDTGAILSQEGGAGRVGQSLTFSAPEIDGYVVSGDAEASLTIGENPEKNAVVFRYTSATPPPEPSPTPGDGPGEGQQQPDATETDDSGAPPDWLPEISPAPSPDTTAPPSDDVPYYTPGPEESASPSPSPSPPGQPAETETMPPAL
ncbi:MAG: hypothetical protein LBC21_05220, partial [Oscillospiraceae bacterium]|nr:hypothetical protein [Oscillospiraceae bacterium]